MWCFMNIFSILSPNSTNIPSDPFHNVVLPHSFSDIELLVSTCITIEFSNSINENQDQDMNPQPTIIRRNSYQPNRIRRTNRISNPPSYLRDCHCNDVSHSKNNSHSDLSFSLQSVLSFDKVSNRHRIFVMPISSNFEPKHYNQASKYLEWCNSMESKLEAMKANNTWNIESLPDGKNTVGGRWVYKTKHDSDGEIERYNARLVAKGFDQKEGIIILKHIHHLPNLLQLRCF